MTLGKLLRVCIKNEAGTPYSILIEKRNVGDALILESGVIVVLTAEEREEVRCKYFQVIEAQVCLGIQAVNAGLYIGFVTGCVSVGKLGDGEVFRITSTAFMSLRGPLTQPDDDKINELKKVFNTGTFYFSYADAPLSPVDITLCCQRRSKATSSDNRFFWNRVMHIPFLRFGVNRDVWLVKVICGAVEMRTVYVGHKTAKAVIISRSGTYRAGTRFNTRGLNDDGHVANFVETEQAIFINRAESSFVQIRGSVPIFWEQSFFQVGPHKLRTSREFDATKPVFERHVTDLKEKYGHQVFVNLLSTSIIGNKEGEAKLSQAFQEHHRLSENCADIPMILYDYHQECRTLSTLGILRSPQRMRTKTEKYLKAHGVFAADAAGCVISSQKGTIRTNCLDCLDRTNNVQTFFGMEMVEQQMQHLNLAEKPHIVVRVKQIFHQMWLNVGNQLSKMSTGTGTLTGGSKFMDASRSAARTFQNNLLDTTKQEAIDLLLGNQPLTEVTDKARSLLPPCIYHAPTKLLREMCLRSPNYVKPLGLRVAVGTYNVNGGKHFRSVVYKSLSLADWLLDSDKQGGTSKTEVLADIGDTSKQCQASSNNIFAIGIQEICDLNSKNLMNASTTNVKAWAQELEKTLCRDTRYILLTHVQLVGVCLYIFIQPDLAGEIRDVAMDWVKTGLLGGAAGNKGAVAIRMNIFNTSIAFVCSHFAAGQSQVAERNADYAEITRRMYFPMGRTLNSHDYVFWCGDFNYRVDMERDRIKENLRTRGVQTVLVHDQLKKEQRAGNVFVNFQEAAIRFHPTYKYDLFSDDYDTSDKQRSPAWTDRVLWRRKKHVWDQEPFWNPGKAVSYRRAELKQSDHRPVLAVVDIDVFVVDKMKRTDVFAEVIHHLGPHDATLLIHIEPTEEEFDNDLFMAALMVDLYSFGDIILIRFVEESIQVTFRDGQCALAASKRRQTQIFGITLRFSLKTPHWVNLYQEEIQLCNFNTVPLSDHKIPLVIQEVENAEALPQQSGAAAAAAALPFPPESNVDLQARVLPTLDLDYQEPIPGGAFSKAEQDTEDESSLARIYEEIANESQSAESASSPILPTLPPPPPPPTAPPPPPRQLMVPPPVPPRAGIPPPIPPRRDL